MKYVIALDFQGHLVELRTDFDSYTELRQYLHDHYEAFKDLKIYIIEYDGDKATYGSPYKFNISTYYSCESGVYHKEHYEELDEGKGVIEIGSTYLVNNDLLTTDLKDDDELVEIAIEKWLSRHYKDARPLKPSWLI